MERAADPQAVASIGRELAALGLTAIGSAGAGIGLRDALPIFEELGAAGCPAALHAAVAANLVLDGLSDPKARSLCDALQAGSAIVALASGAFDGDRAAGQGAFQEGAVTGTFAFVEGVEAATHIVVLTDAPAGVAILESAGLSSAIAFQPGLAVPSLATLHLDKAPADWLSLSAERLADAAAVVRLLCAGRALGAAQRAFDLAVEHAKVRRQFGQLIGQFQALQHKFADGLIALDGTRLALQAAAEARDCDSPSWRILAAAAAAYAGPALREVSIQTHRALGAIGYSEEHEAPRHFRRVHADLARFGGAPRARAELADHLLGPAGD